LQGNTTGEGVAAEGAYAFPLTLLRFVKFSKAG
jgi:hypothetical protein